MYGGAKPGPAGARGPLPVSRILFNKHDKDGSGSISTAEFKDLAYSMGYFLSDQEVEHATKMIDKDGSGHISYDEFLQWWRNDNRFKTLQLSEEEQLTLSRCADYFRYFDKDRSGSLDTEEFKQCHADLVKNGFTSKPFEEVWRQLDNDQSGKVTYNEYIQWLIRSGLIKVKVPQ